MKVRFNTPPTEAAESNGLPLRYAAAKRQVPRLRWYLLVALVTMPLLYFSSHIFFAAIWDSSPGFVVVNEVVVRAQASGVVHALLREGAAVQADAPLATLRLQSAADGMPDINRNGAGAGGTGVNSIAVDGPRTPQEIAAARARIHQADAVLPLVREQLAVAARRLASIEHLVLQGAATAAEQAQAQGQWAAAEAERLRAEADGANARMALQNLEAKAAATPLSTRPEGPNGAAMWHKLVAPTPGNQLHWLVHDGEWVAAGSDVALVYLPDEPIVRVYISPTDMPNARVGVQTELEFMDGGRIPATVVRVGTEAARIPPERVGPLATRMQSIVADLRPDAPLPTRYRINSLPLDVRFSRISRWLR